MTDTTTRTRGTCRACHRTLLLTPTGLLRQHRDKARQGCYGSARKPAGGVEPVDGGLDGVGLYDCWTWSA